MSSSIITLQCLQSVIFEMPCVLSMWGAPLFSFMGLFFLALYFNDSEWCMDFAHR